MNIDGDTKALLNRWEHLRAGDTKAVKREIAVRAIGLLVFSAATFALGKGVYLFPASIGFALFGWSIAEANALRVRRITWPIFSRYIDWDRVRDDLHGPATSS